MRPLSRNRRLAVICAACSTIFASSSSLISRPGMGLSDFGHGLFVGVTLGISVGLLILSIIHMRRDRSTCSRDQTPGV